MLQLVSLIAIPPDKGPSKFWQFPAHSFIADTEFLLTVKPLLTEISLNEENSLHLGTETEHQFPCLSPSMKFPSMKFPSMKLELREGYPSSVAAASNALLTNEPPPRSSRGVDERGYAQMVQISLRWRLNLWHLRHQQLHRHSLTSPPT